jgi:serine/threonine protein kinase
MLGSQLVTGTSLLHYDVLEKIGEGGMGAVYRARDRRLDRLDAIKFLSEDAAADRDRRIAGAYRGGAPISL